MLQYAAYSAYCNGKPVCARKQADLCLLTHIASPMHEVAAFTAHTSCQLHPTCQIANLTSQLEQSVGRRYCLHSNKLRLVIPRSSQGFKCLLDCSLINTDERMTKFSYVMRYVPPISVKSPRQV